MLKTVLGLAQAREALAHRQGLDLRALETSTAGAERTRQAFGRALTALEAVQRIVDDVRREGDEAVRRYTKLLDGADLDALEVPPSAMAQAYASLDRGLRDALEQAAARVRRFQEQAMPRPWMDLKEGLGEMLVPLERVGVYAPGGTAVYPSTVIMTAVPARVAGVKEVVLASPARGGKPHPSVLAAAAIAGVDRVFQIGGVQAIAALAFGTQSVPRVDKVCGPGNLFVTLAKRQVYGYVDIDGLYGPTETVLVADDSADPALCAADLLAQAEHDDLAAPILVTTSSRLVSAVAAEIERQLPTLERRAVCANSLRANGLAVVVDNLEEAMEVANLVAPEHLCLVVREPWAWVGRARNAGGVFLGEASPEVVGDYVAGPSHVMPTAGTARFHSCLGVRHFLKTVPVVGLTEEAFRATAGVVSVVGRAEGLTAHARAAELRLERRMRQQERQGRVPRADA